MGEGGYRGRSVIYGFIRIMEKNMETIYIYWVLSIGDIWLW